MGRGRVPVPPNWFGSDLGRLREALRHKASGPFGAEPRNERKSRRKNRRFCGADSLTTARSAGSCGILKGRCSGREAEAMTLFSAKFGCFLSAAKNGRGVPGPLRHESLPQELRRLNKYRQPPHIELGAKTVNCLITLRAAPGYCSPSAVCCVADKEATR